MLRDIQNAPQARIARTQIHHAGRRQQVQRRREDENQHQTQPEARRGVKQIADAAERHIESRADVPCAEDAEQRAENECDETGAERENDRRREPVEDLAGHGLVRVDGLAHIAVQQIADIADELDVNGLIEAVFFRQRRDHFRRRRFRTGQQPDRVAGCRVDDRKVDAQRQRNAQQARQRAFTNVSCHGFLL